MSRKIVAVCIGPQQPYRTALGDIPLWYHTSPKHYYKRGSKERIAFTAYQRNLAMNDMLRVYPDCNAVLMIDDYYLGQAPVQKLIEHYALLSMEEKCLLGASTWTRDGGRIVFWDTLATPEAALLDVNDAIGIHRVSDIGACYLFPVDAWTQSGARFGVPDYGTDHLPFHRKHKLPLYIDFDVKLWHPPNADVNAPRKINFRKKIGIRRILPYYRGSGFIWCRKYRQNRISASLKRAGSNEENWVRGFVKFSGTQFVDVGANAGMYSIRASKTFDEVIAFEPEEETNLVLRRNVRLNKIHNVRVYQCALMDNTGSMVLNIFQHGGWDSFLDESSNVYASDVPSTKRILQRRETVPMRTLDSFSLKPSLIKIDTEGAEHDVLLGASKTIERSRPEVLVECHSSVLRDLCAEFLSELDYKIWIPMTPLPEYVVGRP